MTLARLEMFSKHIMAVHQAAEIFASIARATREQAANWLHIAMDIHPYGFSSGQYPEGGELVLNLDEGAMLYYRPDGKMLSFPLKSYNQKSLFEAVLSAMQKDILTDFFADTRGDSLAERLISKILAHRPDAIPQALAALSHEENLQYDIQIGKEYMASLYTIFTGIARFRARLGGHMTPIVVWPEHFDLSMLWFKDADMDDHKAHINIGFAPYTPGQFERPYLYAYAYPYPDNFQPEEAPSPAFWHQEGWRGIVLHYDDIAQQEDAALYVEEICLKIFALLKDVLE